MQLMQLFINNTRGNIKPYIGIKSSIFNCWNVFLNALLWLHMSLNMYIIKSSWTKTSYNLGKGEKTDERIDNFRFDAIDHYWCPELGADWYIWLWFGCVYIWPGQHRQQYRIQHNWYCGIGLGYMDVYRQTGASRRTIIYTVYKFHVIRPNIYPLFNWFYGKILIQGRFCLYILIERLCYS